MFHNLCKNTKSGDSGCLIAFHIAVVTPMMRYLIRWWDHTLFFIHCFSLHIIIWNCQIIYGALESMFLKSSVAVVYQIHFVCLDTLSSPVLGNLDHLFYPSCSDQIGWFLPRCHHSHQLQLRHNLIAHHLMTVLCVAHLLPKSYWDVRHLDLLSICKHFEKWETEVW